MSILSPKRNTNRKLSPKSLLNQQKLEKRLKKELSPFTLVDLPLSEDETILFTTRYLYRKILGAGSFGVVISVIDKQYLEEYAIKVFFIYLPR